MAEKIFRARLRQESGGVWRAFYRGEMQANVGDDVGRQAGATLPDTHIGTDPDAVKFFVEDLARRQGFDRVEWDGPTPDIAR